MNKQSGFGLIESLLIILILAVVGFGGYTVWHNQHKTVKSTIKAAVSTTKTAAATTPAPTSTQKPASSDDAVNFVKSAYDTYLKDLAAGKTRAESLNEIKSDFTAAEYDALLGSSTTYDPIMCALKTPQTYKLSLEDSSVSTADIDFQDTSAQNGVARVTVDLSSLKITSVSCPN